MWLMPLRFVVFGWLMLRLKVLRMSLRRPLRFSIPRFAVSWVFVFWMRVFSYDSVRSGDDGIPRVGISSSLRVSPEHIVHVVEEGAHHVEMEIVLVKQSLSISDDRNNGGVLHR